MKKKNVFGVLFLSGVVAFSLLTGCGSSNKSASGEDYAAESAYEADYGVYEEAEAPAAYEDGSSSGTDSVGQVQNNENRKLITTVNISAETDDMDKSLGAIENKVKALGGYIEKSDIYNGSYSSHVSRNASLTVRIPKERLDEFIEVIEGGNNITNKSVNVDDVTLSYVDTESRKNSLRTEEKRLLDIMEKAETVEDIIIIEDKLASVRYELESIESQLRSYDNKIDYSTVYIDLSEVRVFTPVEEESALTRMGNGFKESMSDVIDGIVEFFIWVVVHIPQLIFLLIIAVLIFVICRIVLAASKKSRARKMAKMQMAYQAQNMQQVIMPQMNMQQMNMQQQGPVQGNVQNPATPTAAPGTGALVNTESNANGNKE